MTNTYTPNVLDNPLLGLFFGEIDPGVSDMKDSLTVGYANVKDTLPDREALTAVLKIVSHHPHVFGLGEWAAGREDVLRHISPQYHHMRSHGGGGVAVWDPKRLSLEGAHTIHIAPAQDVGHLAGRRDVLPPSLLPIYQFKDLVTKETVPLRIMHLTAEVQKGKGYRTDPAHAKRVARHKGEREALIQQAQHGGYIIGDSNFQGFTIPPLVSCWQGHPTDGTLANRTVDYVFGEKKSKSAHDYPDPSDHDFVIAVY